MLSESEAAERANLMPGIVDGTWETLARYIVKLEQEVLDEATGEHGSE
jgi:hypothetical protein